MNTTIFHVIDKDGAVDNSRDWVITQDGELRSVTEGWGCEGGGGSDAAPDGHRAIFGQAPQELAKEPIAHHAIKAFQCPCGRKFSTESAMRMHMTVKGHTP